MREQQSGSIVNISSIAAVASTNLTAYKISKLGMNALSQNLANSNAKHGIRVNTIMPGLMDTPMAIETTAEATGMEREQLREFRDKSVPLRGKMGTAWDIAYASLFLHSDEANFITGVVLPVDGGQSARVG
jgi:NAD(P)-dependent dehydrogenase (short-subunit alcohol dehydrogenase family)